MYRLPSWANTIRPHQQQAVEDILSAFDQGEVIAILDAPTGSGKTLIGEMVRQQLSARALYLCSSIALQHQFLKDFPDAVVIKGAANYPTADTPSKFPELNCGDCQKTRVGIPACYDCDDRTVDPDAYHCGWCHPVQDCPYGLAKRDALISPLTCTNTAYFLHEANYVGALPKGRELVIIDEADTLEDQLLSFIEVSISPRQQKEFGIPAPDRRTVESSWVRWASTTAEHLSSISISGKDVRSIRKRSALDRLRSSFKRLNDPVMGLAAGGWVYTGYDRNHIAFKPIEVSPLAHDFLWKHGKRFLLMSATTISFPVMADNLGINTYAGITVPSTFPPDQRPIHVMPVAPMSRKNKDIAYPLIAEAVATVIDNHPTDRILVHTVSYDLNRAILAHLEQGPGILKRVVSYDTAQQKQRAIDRYLAREGAVLLAPSLERGIDLPGDDCRVIVVCKVPFPSLGDKQIAAKLYSKGGQVWYSVQTVRSLVQMTGRGMRNADDFCESYVLDSQFIDQIWRRSRHLLPEWWKEAINMKAGTL